MKRRGSAGRLGFKWVLGRVNAVILTLLTVMSMMSGPIAHSSESMVIREGNYHFRLKADTSDKKIYLYRLGGEEPLPDQMTISLFRSEGPVEKITLKSLAPAAGSGLSKTPSYAGTLGPAQSPVIGLELKFSLTPGSKPKVLRWSRD